MGAPEPLVWLIDAYVQIFRAFHSLPDMRSPDGRPVAAFRGYVSSLARLLERQKPTHVAVCWDHAMTSFRNEIWADYKLGRTEAPAELAPQIPLCARATLALGIPLFQSEGFEADDVIATLVRGLDAAGARVAIVTTDKDLGALVSERVTLFDAKKETHVGPDAIRAKFGVPPERVPDYLTLAGDAVDNIPGARGIGARSAAALLGHFGALDAIPSDFAKWQGVPLRGAARVHRAFVDSAEEIALSRRLVALRDDLPLAPRLDELEYAGADRRALQALLAEQGAAGLLQRVPLFRE